MTRVDRSRLPETGPARAFALPHVVRDVLSNGLSLRVARHPAAPVASAVLMVPGGVSSDPPDRRGRAALLADLLDEGTGSLDAPGFSAAVADIGADLEIEAGAEATLLGITSLSRVLPDALGLLAAAATRPALREPDLERVRTLRLERLRQLQDQPAALAERAFARLTFGAHPYGNPGLGSAEALRAIRPDELRTLHADVYRPGRATLIVVSDWSVDAMHQACRAAFAEWIPGAASPDASDLPGLELAPPARSTVVVPRPGAAQSELRIGHVCAVSRRSPDYHAALVLNAVLGGQFVSRLNLNLRERRGLTYGVRSAFDLRRHAGAFAVQTSVHTEGTVTALEEITREIAGVIEAQPVQSDELALAQASLTLGYPRSFETAQQVVRALAQLALHDLPDDHYARFVPAVSGVDAAAVQDVARRHLQPGALATVVVGDDDRLAAALSAHPRRTIDAADLLA